MNTVNKDMRDAEKNLAGLEKCCGLCSCPWQKVLIFNETLRLTLVQGKAPPKDEEYKKIWKKNQDGKVVNSQPMNVADDRNAVSAGFNLQCTLETTELLMQQKRRKDSQNSELREFVCNFW